MYTIFQINNGIIDPESLKIFYNIKNAIAYYIELAKDNDYEFEDDEEKSYNSRNYGDLVANVEEHLCYSGTEIYFSDKVTASDSLKIA